MNAGKVLACDVPQKLIEARGAANLEEAFIAYMEDAIGAAASGGKDVTTSAAAAGKELESSPESQELSGIRLRLGRMLAYSANETMQILRDPVRLTFAFVGSALLMLVFGFGITTDVEHVRYATFDLDRSAESRAYLEQFAGTPRYFTQARPVRSADDALQRLQSDDVSLVLEVPPNFGRNLRKGLQTRGHGASGWGQYIPWRDCLAICSIRSGHQLA
jgi:ribosome-dependent ATPase